MDTHPTLPQALWELTPPAVHAYVEALAARLASMGDLVARVVALEALVQALQGSVRDVCNFSQLGKCPAKLSIWTA